VEPYGVFWLRIKEVRPDGLVVVENMAERGKREIAKVNAAIEKDLIYPAVAGGDITKFGIKSHFYVLISQDPKQRKGYDEEWMITHLPLTYAYLKEFESVLRQRAAFIKYYHREVKKDGKVIDRVPIGAFYSMYNIDELSFAKYRVVWKRMASRIEAVVLSRLRAPFGLKSAVSTDTTSLFALDNAEEAHCLCGILNSALVDAYIRSFSSAGRGFGAPSVMEKLAIPKFNAKNKIQIAIAALSKEAHEAVERGKPIDRIQPEINREVEELWNISSRGVYA
jgi:hypothetical protein